MAEPARSPHEALRAQVEADLDDIEKVREGSRETREKLDHTLRAYARLEHSNAAKALRISELMAALHQVAHDLSGLCIYLKADKGKRHTTIGEACGIDACIVCLAESTAQEALGIAEHALKGKEAT